MILPKETNGGKMNRTREDFDLLELSEYLCEIQSPEKMKTLLSELLTPAEQSNLFLRWELMKLLKEGVSQRKVADSLGISLCKITRGASLLKDENSVINEILKIYHSKEEGK